MRARKNKPEAPQEDEKMALSIRELVSAIFNGAPTPQLAERYTAQLTALISLYIDFVAIFLLGLYIRAVGRRRDLTEERRLFKTWIAWSLVFSLLVIAAFLVWFLWSPG